MKSAIFLFACYNAAVDLSQIQAVSDVRKSADSPDTRDEYKIFMKDGKPLVVDWECTDTNEAEQQMFKVERNQLIDAWKEYRDRGQSRAELDKFWNEKVAVRKGRFSSVTETGRVSAKTPNESNGPKEGRKYFMGVDPALTDGPVTVGYQEDGTGNLKLMEASVGANYFKHEQNPPDMGERGSITDLMRDYIGIGRSQIWQDYRDHIWRYLKAAITKLNHSSLNELVKYLDETSAAIKRDLLSEWFPGTSSIKADKSTSDGMADMHYPAFKKRHDEMKALGLDTDLKEPHYHKIQDIISDADKNLTRTELGVLVQRVQADLKGIDERYEQEDQGPEAGDRITEKAAGTRPGYMRVNTMFPIDKDLQVPEQASQDDIKVLASLLFADSLVAQWIPGYKDEKLWSSCMSVLVKIVEAKVTAPNLPPFKLNMSVDYGQEKKQKDDTWGPADSQPIKTATQVESTTYTHVPVPDAKVELPEPLSKYITEFEINVLNKLPAAFGSTPQQMEVLARIAAKTKELYNKFHDTYTGRNKPTSTDLSLNSLKTYTLASGQTVYLHDGDFVDPVEETLGGWEFALRNVKGGRSVITSKLYEDRFPTQPSEQILELMEKDREAIYDILVRREAL